MAKGLLRAAVLVAGLVALGAIATPPRPAVADGESVSLGGIRVDLPDSVPVDVCPNWVGPLCRDDSPRMHDVREQAASMVASARLDGGPVSHGAAGASMESGSAGMGPGLPVASGTAARQVQPESWSVTYISAGRPVPADDDAGAVWTFVVAGLLALASGVLGAARRMRR